MIVWMALSVAMAENEWTRCYPHHVSQEVYCRTIQVPVNHLEPTGEQLELSMVKLPAIRSDAALDPVFVLAGGPGQGASDVIAALYPALRKVHQERTLIFLDQRGTGESGVLQCDISESNTSDIPLEELTTCRAEMTVDAQWYQSNHLADDTNWVRQKLGYEQINLYGVSYGTRLAMTIMRRHPDSVRSAVLDGVAPFQTPIGGDFGATARQMLEQVLLDCEVDDGCSNAFPELRTEYISVVERLTDPQTIEHPHPRTGKPTETVVDVEVFWGALQQLLYNGQTAAMIPYAIHQIATQNDWSPVLGWMDSSPFSDIPIGLYLSIICAEDATQIDYSTQPVNGLGVQTTTQLQEMCGVWNTIPVGSDFFEPLRSDIPTLLLSGRLDPVTPASNGEVALQTLENAKHLVVSGTAHNTIQQPCVYNLVRDFMQSTDVQSLDDSCTTEPKRPAFILSATGTAP